MSESETEKDKHGTSKVVREAIEEALEEIMGAKIGDETFYELFDKILKTHYIISKTDNPSKHVKIDVNKHLMSGFVDLK